MRTHKSSCGAKLLRFNLNTDIIDISAKSGQKEKRNVDAMSFGGFESHGLSGFWGGLVSVGRVEAIRLGLCWFGFRFLIRPLVGLGGF
jgi:hypothetical protein